MIVSENRVNYKLFMIREEKQTKKSDSDRVVEDLYCIPNRRLDVLGSIEAKKAEATKGRCQWLIIG